MRVPDGLIYIRFGYIIHAGLISDTCFKHEDRIEREGDMHAIVYSLQSSAFGLYDLRNTHNDKNQFYFHAGNLTILHVFIKRPFKLFCLCLSYLCVQ